MNRTRALVTGATGFVGSHLCRRLLRDNWEIHIVVRSQSNLTQINDIDHSGQVHVHDGSTTSMLEIVQSAKPEIVFHLASLFITQHKPENIDDLILSNIRFGTQLLEAMVFHGVRYLVNTGTSWQHYQDEAYSPVNLYAATKQAFESLLQFYVETTPLTVITLMLFDTYGPNDPRPKLLNHLKRIAATGETLDLSPGEQYLDMVHVEDVVEAFLIAGKLLLKGSFSGMRSYAICTGKHIRLKDLVEIIEKTSGKKLSICWGKRPYRQREVMVPWSTGETLPGWSPKTNLEEELKKLF